MGILEEITGEIGGLLWRSLRTVTLWASVPPADRLALFAPGAEEQRMADLLAISPGPDLEEPLTILAGILGRPESARADLVALACTRIAQWANARGARATELEYAQAAAAACPGDPRLALAVGRAARDRAEYARAETWLHRTVALARQVGDWDSYSRAYIALGKMFVARGAFPSARKNLQKALRAAERRGLREPQGMAAHDLFTVEAECSNVTEAQEYAARALRAYGAGHPDLPSLAYDVALVWVLQGRFADALLVFQAAVPRMRPWHQSYGHGGLARAAGAMGEESVFDATWQVIWSLSDDTAGKANALVEAAHGAASLGRLGQARQAGEAAANLARQRGQTKVLFDAEAVLQSVQMERRASTSRAQSAPASLVAAQDSVVGLAQQFVQSLEAGLAV
jgi:tetratricopeptide (TPR) repeat protein